MDWNDPYRKARRQRLTEQYRKWAPLFFLAIYFVGSLWAGRLPSGIGQVIVWVIAGSISMIVFSLPGLFLKEDDTKGDSLLVVIINISFVLLLISNMLFITPRWIYPWILSFSLVIWPSLGGFYNFLADQKLVNFLTALTLIAGISAGIARWVSRRKQ